MSTRTVRVQVPITSQLATGQETLRRSQTFGYLLVHVEQELLHSTSGVNDLDDRVVGPIDPSRRVSPFLTMVITKKNTSETQNGQQKEAEPDSPGKQDVLRRSTGGSNGVDRDLERLGERPDVGDIVRFVHQPKDDFGVRAVLLGQLFPDASQLSVGRSTLSDDSAVPTSIVVEVEDGVSALGEGVLDELVVSGKPGRVEGPAELTTDGGVPAKGKSEDVGSVLDKVVDLRGGRVGAGHRIDVVA